MSGTAGARAGRSVADIPGLIQTWDYAVNGDLRPEDVSSRSDTRVSWRCPKGHQWVTQVRSRTRSKSGCPQCGSARYANDEYNLALRNPDLAAEWDYEANGDLCPEGVTPKSGKIVGWVCSYGHRWTAPVFRRASGSGCPVCARRRSTGEHNLAVARPDLAAEWDYEANAPLRPEDVTPKSCRRVHWVCAKGHRWSALIFNRTDKTGCPSCVGGRATPYYNLAVCRPDLAAQWDYEANGDLRPEDVSPGSKKRVSWICPKGHRSTTTVKDRNKGARCRKCAAKSRAGRAREDQQREREASGG